LIENHSPSISAHATNLLPYFIEFANRIFPHLKCIEDLKKISDLRDPVFWWVV
jgi:hypothetical protein